LNCTLSAFIDTLYIFKFSCTVATAGALASQSLSGQKINPRAVFAYSIFGLLFGGTVPHYFFTFFETLVPDVPYKKIIEFLLERFTFAPVFTALSLYFLSIFEGKSPEQALKTLKQLYLTVLTTNWRYLSLPVFINFNFVPLFLRVFVANLIGFFWILYLSDKRRRAAAAKKESN
jgi:peroxisomal membrane protein 2